VCVCVCVCSICPGPYGQRVSAGVPPTLSAFVLLPPWPTSPLALSRVFLEELFVMVTVLVTMEFLNLLEELWALARVVARPRASGGSRERERMAVSLALSCAP
jgi:hypothetical protein